MRYRDIQGTDLRVPAICMGGVMLSKDGDYEDSFSLLDTYMELGGNFIDTANVYGKWLPNPKNYSEMTIGAWLKERKNRHKVIIGTKGGHPQLSSMNVSRLSRNELAADLDESLKALDTDYIDLYWLHRDDIDLPVSGILETLNSFMKEGKIRYFGCSNWKTYRIREAMKYACENGLAAFVGNQPRWSLAVPNENAFGDKTMVCMDEESIDLHKETGLAAIPYSSQANGFFSKLAVNNGAGMRPGIRKNYYNEENLKRYERILKLSRELAVPISCIVLGYLTSQPFTTIPIAGCRTVEQVKDSMAAGDVVLSREMIRFLECGE